MSRELLLPFGVDGSGAIASTTDRDRILQQHVESVVGTQRGERVMRADYGTNLISGLFEPIDDVVASDMEEQIRDALNLLAPEVSVIDVTVDQDLIQSALIATVRYTHSNGMEGDVSVTVTNPEAVA